MINVTHTASLLEIVYTLLSISGVLLMGYVAYDNRKDLLLLKRRKSNGYSRLTASIGIWDAVAAMTFHCLFLLLGIVGLAAPPPLTAAARQRADEFALGFILMQLLILGVQLRNQLARQRIRNQLLAKAVTGEAAWLQRCRDCVQGLQQLQQLKEQPAKDIGKAIEELESKLKDDQTKEGERNDV